MFWSASWFCRDRLPDRHTRKKARARRSTPAITAMAMPAFAPELRPEEEAVEDDAEAEALDVGEEVDVLVIVFELDVVVEAPIEEDDDDDTAAVDVPVPVIELDELAASRSTCGATPGQVSVVGFPQSTPLAYVHEQHAHNPVSGLYITSGTGLSVQCSVHWPLAYVWSVQEAVRKPLPVRISACRL